MAAYCEIAAHSANDMFSKYKNLIVHLVFPASGFGVAMSIRKTCPCNEYPLKPHFYIAKLGYAGVYLFFLFLLQNKNCGYSLEPPRPQSMF